GGSAINSGTSAGATTTVPFNTLPADIQTQIAAQLPVGAQLGNIVAENTAQGTIYRAQIMQNGVLSEMTLTGLGATSLPNGTTAATTTGASPGTLAGSGFVVGTP